MIQRNSAEDQQFFNNLSTLGFQALGDLLTPILIEKGLYGLNTILGKIKTSNAERAGYALFSNLSGKNEQILENTLSQMANEGYAFAGAGTSKVLRDADRLVATYGGKAADWSKVAGKNTLKIDGHSYQLHWYENKALGIKVEYKCAIPTKTD